MDNFTRSIIWQQLGAAIDMLENAIHHCPDQLWSDRSLQPEFWYVAYHTIFFLDLYSSDSVEDYLPPAPFGLEELDPAGVMPERVYTKDELLSFLAHGREKTRNRIATIGAEKAAQRCGIEWVDLSEAELFLSTIRHVQHHTAQLNLILRQQANDAPRWVFKTKQPLSCE